MLSLFFALILTILIEFLVLAFLTRKSFKKALFCVVLINAFTVPLTNYGFYYVIPNFLLIEVLVFLIEIPLIKVLFETSLKKAIIFSFIANTVTALISLFLWLFWVF